ncbi:MAG: hypothetical protein AAGC58_03095 [Asticcacaulis sp.]|uniref:hypothetical protein n=1 Tax=Asticcacaulis tiandongensis TaxID=2565365 RepID=UPI0015E86F8E|nr:hypothetical protein [Asticcacaulis tiandongensis]
MSEKSSLESLKALRALQSAATKTIERKRRLGQYWVVWDGQKPLIVNPENGDAPVK